VPAHIAKDLRGTASVGFGTAKDARGIAKDECGIKYARTRER